MWLYGDAHVHVYPAFDASRLLSQASQRAEALAAPFLLLLAESAGHDWYRAAREAAAGGRGPLGATAEPLALQLQDCAPASSVFVVAGRQIVSTEGLEVLGLALDPDCAAAAIVDRTRCAEELLEALLDADAVAVLPWGFGKWLGERGRRVAELARQDRLRDHARFFLGDVPQRCWPWPRPAVFEAPARVLCGSDPLPLPGGEARVGCLGFRIEASLDAQQPARSLLSALTGRARLEATGSRDALLRTLLAQGRYALRRRGRATAPGAG